jgi:hypothetical protein
MADLALTNLLPRARHPATLAVFFALFIGILVPIARALEALRVFSPQLLLLVIAPWVLGLLVLLLERSSPVKFWAAPLLLSLSAPALVLWLNSLIVLGWTQMPSPGTLIVTLLVNVLLIGRFTLFLHDMCPNCCPDCHKRSMIPLRKFWGPESRTRSTRWCSSCGALYWRTIVGELKKEQRQTWLDRPDVIPASEMPTLLEDFPGSPDR